MYKNGVIIAPIYSLHLNGHSACWFAHAAEAVKCECLFWYVHLNIFELDLICTLYIPSTAKIYV